MHLVLGPLLDSYGFSVMFASFCTMGAILFVTYSGMPEACGETRGEVSFRSVFGIIARSKWFFANITILGAGFSMVEGMLFLLLQQLQASTFLCGLSVMVTVIFELPIFAYASSLLRRFGTTKLILLAQLAWVIRAVLYSRMSAAWAVLLVEPLHGVTFALAWVGAIDHVAKPAVSGEGLQASSQGLLTACFLGLGPIIGLLGGGLLFDTVGGHAAYAIFAVFVSVSGLIYWSRSHIEEAEPELETVLKGRLHQAVSIAQMTEIPNRWTRVKELSEDVLQFDFNNAHARWLRGLALKSMGKTKEAEEECRRAVDCARSQGKDGEAQQWDKELQETFGGGTATSRTPKATPQAAAADAGAPGGQAEAQPAAKKAPSPALQKGFFNRTSRKTEVTDQGKDGDEAKTARDGLKEGHAAKPSGREVELEQELTSLRKSLHDQEAELKKKIMSAEARHAEEQHFREGSEAILQELENCIHAVAPSSSSSSSSAAQVAVQQATERTQAGKAWAENEQQRYVEFSTEVLTLQEMSVREFREQEDTASKQSKELRELAKRFGDLLRLAKRLDGFVREHSSGREIADPDVQHMAQQVADFHSLPWTSKLSAMLDDGALLRIVAMFSVLGMMLGLALVVETGFANACSLTCRRTQD
ncbi:MFSD6 [Symbiodinium sp. KB8]|nr:MFSD6 [Symbiodinium sp. KB8]